jgi:large subunit ribosomal protein L3
MTQVFLEDGSAVPVTVVEAGPCNVVDVCTTDRDGYRAVQLGWGDVEERKLTKPELGHLKARGSKPVKHLREFRTDRDDIKPGDTFDVELFEVGSKVDVIGTSIGRGFQGVVKRHGFSGGPASHGSKTGNLPGSIGCSASPSRVLKGRKLPGHMGDRRVTVRNLRVVRIDKERNLVLLRGAVPGAVNGLVMVRQVGKGKTEN